jgi:hypothetical protein
VNTTVKRNKAGATDNNKYYIMKLETCQTFARLLESFVVEASSSMNILAAHPGGQEVVKHLHKNMALAHDLDYSPIEKISWSDIKGRSNGTWILVQGTKGTGAIRARGDRYTAVASTGGEVKSIDDSRGGNILDFFKDEIGKVRQFHMARNTRAVDDKRRKRDDNKDATGAQPVSKDTLVKKFKPLWIRAISAAVADIKGHVANMIKNDAFDKAKKKLERVSTLQSAVYDLESGSEDTPEFIRTSVQIAIYMAASHHYPDQTGNITRSGWGGGYSAQFDEGPRRLLADITSGDTAKLGTVLGFFKRTLISG